MVSQSPELWSSGIYGSVYETGFRHALNEWEDWSQGPCSLFADGHAESWIDWDKIVAEFPASEDYFSIPLR